MTDCELSLFFGLGASEVTGDAVVSAGGAIHVLDEALEVTDGAAEVLLADGALGLALVFAGRTEDAAFRFGGVGGIMSSSSVFPNFL